LETAHRRSLLFEEEFKDVEFSSLKNNRGLTHSDLRLSRNSMLAKIEQPLKTEMSLDLRQSSTMV
jgi:hypothetical protein